MAIFNNGCGLKALRVSLTGTGAPLSATPIYAQSVRISIPSANSADVKIGGSDVESVYATIVKGTSLQLDLLNFGAERQGWDLSKIYVDGTNADVVEVLYEF